MSWILNTIVALAEGDEEDDRREEDEDDQTSLESAEGGTKRPKDKSRGTKRREGQGDAEGGVSEGEEDGEDGEEGDEQEGKSNRRQDQKGDGFTLKDDLSELQRSLRKGFKGISSFLAGEPAEDTSKIATSDAKSQVMQEEKEEEEEDEDGSACEEDSKEQPSWTPAPTPGAMNEADGIKPNGAGEHKLRGDEAATAPSGEVAARDAKLSSSGGSAEEGTDPDKEKVVKGMQDDLAELSSRFKTGLFKFSSVIRAVTGDDLVNASKREGSKEGAPLKSGKSERVADGEEGEVGEEEEEDGPTVGAAAAEALLRAAKEDMKAISGTLASGISGFSSLASKFLAAAGAEWEDEEGEEGAEKGGRHGMDSEEGGAVGITEDVLSFAHNVSLHPETWIDFPLPDEDDEPEDFRPTREQEEHFEAVEMRVPRLVAVRLELTPAYISEQRFWKIYFVLLHSHLPPAASAVLSTPAILAARARVVRQLQQAEQQKETGATEAGTGGIQGEPQSTVSAPSPAAVPVATPALPSSAESTQPKEPASSQPSVAVAPATVAPSPSPEPPSKPEPAPEAAAPTKKAEVERSMADEKEEEVEADEWLNEDEDGAGLSGTGGDDDEEVSFSDLEEDEDEEKEAEAGLAAGKKEAAALYPSQAGAAGGAPASGLAGSGAGPTGPPSGAKEKASGADWVDLKRTQDGSNSSGGSDNHSADWQTVDSDDLP